MKKLLTICTLSLALLLSACGADPSAPVLEPTGTPAASGQVEPSTLPADIPPSPDTSKEDPLEGLTENLYDGLELTATVDPAKEIQPGGLIEVTVKAKNTGDQSIFYALGSGSFTTPQAIRLQSESFQRVLPEDQLGMSTMDYRTNELKPGEELEYTMFALAIAPFDEFDQYTFTLYNTDKTYIATLTPAQLQEKYTEVAVIGQGSYTGSVYMIYSLPEDDASTQGIAFPGYNQATFEITIVEQPLN